MIEPQPSVLSLSDAAATKLRELTRDEPNPDIGLRIYVYSGGCSGFRYGMMLEEAPTAEDRIMEANGVRVYVDVNSVRYLEGAQIDWRRSGEGGRRRLGDGRRRGRGHRLDWRRRTPLPPEEPGDGNGHRPRPTATHGRTLALGFG